MTKGILRRRGSPTQGRLSLPLSLGQDDRDWLQDANLDTPPPGQVNRHTVVGPLAAQIDALPRNRGHSLIFSTNQWHADFHRDHPGTYPLAQLHLPNTDTRLRAGSPPDMSSAISIVTLITCYQSQITGESTCPKEYVHSKRESTDPQHVVNNVHVLRAYIPS